MSAARTRYNPPRPPTGAAPNILVWVAQRPRRQGSQGAVAQPRVLDTATRYAPLAACPSSETRWARSTHGERESAPVTAHEKTPHEAGLGPYRGPDAKPPAGCSRLHLRDAMHAPASLSGTDPARPSASPTARLPVLARPLVVHRALVLAGAYLPRLSVWLPFPGYLPGLRLMAAGRESGMKWLDTSKNRSSRPSILGAHRLRVLLAIIEAGWA